MIVIDGDVHISSESDINQNKITSEEILNITEENQVDIALPSPKLSYTRQVKEDNKAIADAQNKYPNKIIGVGGINPRLGIEDSLEELNICIKKYKFKAIKFNGARDDYYIDDKKITYPFFEEIASRNLILVLHSGADEPDKTHPWRVARIAKDFPNLKIQMNHLGGVRKPGLYEAAIEAATKHDNIFLVGSEADPKAIIKAIDVLGAERVAYGSDAPFVLMNVALAIYETILKKYSSSEKELVMGLNLKRVYDL